MAKRTFTRNIKQDYEYIPVSERFAEDEEGKEIWQEGKRTPAESPVLFKFKPLSTKQLKTIQDSVIRYENGGDSMRLMGNTNNYKITQEQVFAWENICDEDGKEIKLERKDGKLTDAMMDYIGDEWINEIAQTITSVSRYPKEADVYLGKF